MHGLRLQLVNTELRKKMILRSVLSTTTAVTCKDRVTPRKSSAGIFFFNLVAQKYY